MEELYSIMRDFLEIEYNQESLVGFYPHPIQTSMKYLRFVLERYLQYTPFCTEIKGRLICLNCSNISNNKKNNRQQHHKYKMLLPMFF